MEAQITIKENQDSLLRFTCFARGVTAEQRQKVESVDCWQNGFIGWDALVPTEPLIEVVSG